MIEPYNAMGLIFTVWSPRNRDDIKRNIEHLHGMMKAVSWLSSLDFPMRYVAVSEGALQGCTDEVFDTEHAQFARESAIGIPGPETEMLSEIAEEFGVYLVAQAKATDPDFPEMFFNIGFILDPEGSIILKHYKSSPLFTVEHSVCSHDVWDRWVELHGEGLDSSFPVADRKPFNQDEYREQVNKRQIREMQERGIWAEPWSQKAGTDNRSQEQGGRTFDRQLA